MNIHDIRDLANVLMQAQPGAVNDAAVQGTWRAVVSDVAEEIRKRSKHPEQGLGMVTDHRFDMGVFIDVVMGKGQYELSDPAENDASWDAVFETEGDGLPEPFYQSAVVLGQGEIDPDMTSDIRPTPDEAAARRALAKRMEAR